MLWSNLLLSCAELSQCILNILRHVGLEYRTWVHGLGHRHLPCLQKAFHVLASVLVHDEIGVHEGSIKVAADVDSVWGADILDNRIKNIEGWEFPFRACLHMSVMGG